MGLLEGLEAESYDREYSDRELLRRLGRYLRSKTRMLSWIAVAVLSGAAMGAAFPLLLSRGVDAIAGNVSPRGAAALAGAILLAGLAAWGLDLLRQWYAASIVGDLVLELRRDAFDAVLAQDMAFFDEHPAGGLASRVASDTQAFGTMVQLVLDVSGQALLILVMTLVLFTIDIRLAVVTVALALVIVAVTLVFRLLARRATRSLQRAVGGLNAHLQESLGGISVARNFRQEGRLYGELVAANDRWYRASERVSTLFSGIWPFMLTLTGLGTVAVVYFGGRGVLAGSLTPGEWYLFLQSVALFWGPLTNITSFWGQLQSGLSAGERVFALIDAERRVRQTDRKPLPGLSGRIEFRDVTFRYASRETVLEGFNLRIEPDETVALVGHTGAGKSSIARLVARSYEFQGGRILVDGRDIRTLDLEGYRRHLGIVPQMPLLFSGTVADNVRYARPDASDDEVRRAAHLVAAGDWLEQLPQGLRTPVGEMGRNLSTGQRQLVALARVLLQDPAILILDEATASVDPLTEAQVQEGLDVALGGRTSIVIAHRLPTVRKADRIIVLRKGEVVEEGSHEVLLRRGGYYRELYDRYFSWQAPDYEGIGSGKMAAP